MSFDIPDVLAVLREKLDLDNESLTIVAKELNKIEEEVKEEKKSGPKTKSRFVVLLRSDDPLVAKAIPSGAFLMSVPDDETTNEYSQDALISRLDTAIAQHNDAPKGKRGRKKSKIDTYATAFSTLKSKTIKASGSEMTIKQKGIPCEIVILDRESPKPVT